jgi:hypothetical protein
MGFPHRFVITTTSKISVIGPKEVARKAWASAARWGRCNDVTHFVCWKEIDAHALALGQWKHTLTASRILQKDFIRIIMGLLNFRLSSSCVRCCNSTLEWLTLRLPVVLARMRHDV